MNDDDDHERCEHCEGLICPEFRCSEMDACMKDGSTGNPSLWTSYGVHVHIRCTAGYERALEEFDAWASRLEAEAWAHNVVAGGAK
jgi:hypothetical protein